MHNGFPNSKELYFRALFSFYIVLYPSAFARERAMNSTVQNGLKGAFLGFFFLLYVLILSCFICRSSDSTVLEDAGIKPRTVATLTLTGRHCNQLARSNPQTLVEECKIELGGFCCFL
jgi:hypothetical protein